jgi:hypothetical protein
LGVHNFIQLNRALLRKWLWRYAREGEALWRLVSETKFKSLSGSGCAKEVLGTFGVACGKILEEGGISFTTLFDLRRGLGLK